MNFAPWLQAPLQQVQVLKKNNSLSHALLIMGADGVGQEALAQRLVKDLMCERAASACGACHSCQLMQANTHPDYRVLSGEEATIKIDQVRQLISQINQKPQVGKSKVVLISHAQAMNINAANALLKALEEPPMGTYFILTSSDSSSLLPTIRSRCLLVKIPTPHENSVREWLQQFPEKEELTSLFWLTKQPYRLLQIQQQGKAALFLSLPDTLGAYLSGDLTLDKMLKDVNNDNIEDYCNGFAAILYQCLCHSTGTPLNPVIKDIYPLIIARLGIQRLLLRYQALQNMKSERQKTNLNPVMQMTYELNQW